MNAALGFVFRIYLLEVERMLREDFQQTLRVYKIIAKSLSLQMKKGAFEKKETQIFSGGEK